VNQHRGAAGAVLLEQEAVGGGAPLEAVFDFETEAARAEAAQAEQAGFDRQGDDAPIGRGWGGGHQ